MKCPNCGAVYDDNCRFCGTCGAALESEKKGTHRVPILILIGLTILGLCVYFATGGSAAPAQISSPESSYQDSFFTVEHGALYAQFDFPGVTEITVPETLGDQTVTAIGRYCFAECDDVTAIALPDTIERIGDSAFSGCDSLRAMDLPPALTYIGDDAFSACGALEAIHIPASVESIGDYAFYGCSSLSYIFYDGTIAEWKALYPHELCPETAVCCTDGNFSQAE